MTTAVQITKRVNHGYVDVFLRRRNSDGSYEANWLDVTRYVTTAPTIDQSLDSGDMDIGVFTVGNITLAFNNRDGRFCEPWDSRSLWAAFETRHLTKIKIEAGYLDDDFAKITEDVFEGLIDDRGVSTSDRDEVSMKVLSLDSAFKQVTVPAGSLSSAILASQAIYILCSRGEITVHMTVDQDNIVPANDIVIDDPNAFDARKLDDVLNELMLITDSVLYVDEDRNLIVRERLETRRVKREFRRNAASGKSDNVYAINGFNSGRQRVRNYWQWSNTTIVAKSSELHIKRWGANKKTVSSTAITNAATKLAVVERLRDQWQFPKREVEIVTDYLANELSIFDMVTVDCQPPLDRQTDLPIGGTGTAVAGSCTAARFAAGLHIEPDVGFKIIGFRHDLGSFKTTLRLREKGNQINDGYIVIPLTKAIDVAVAGSPVDVDISAYEMDARFTKVEVLDAGDEYDTLNIGVRRTGEDTIRINAGALVGTVRLLLVECEA